MCVRRNQVPLWSIALYFCMKNKSLEIKHWVNYEMEYNGNIVWIQKGEQKNSDNLSCSTLCVRGTFVSTFLFDVAYCLVRIKFTCKTQIKRQMTQHKSHRSIYLGQSWRFFRFNNILRWNLSHNSYVCHVRTSTDEFMGKFRCFTVNETIIICSGRGSGILSFQKQN